MRIDKFNALLISINQKKFEKKQQEIYCKLIYEYPFIWKIFKVSLYEISEYFSY